MLDVRSADGETGAALLAGCYRGTVWRLARRSATADAVALAHGLAVDVLGPDPQEAQHRLDAEAFVAAYSELRRRLLARPDNLRLGRRLVESLGLDVESTRIDRLRLRAVTSGGHRLPAAAAAYHVHRDTWYANPAAQVNLWIAVGDVTADEAFDFWPDHWDEPIANDSERFRLDEWHARGGWQSGAPGKHYPGTLAAPRGRPERLACGDGEALLFSATHLHGSHPHDSGRTRFSLELRIVDERDVDRVAGERRLDDRSSGSTLGEMVPAGAVAEARARLETWPPDRSEPPRSPSVS